ncbi:MAG: hypothetical protein ACYCWB_06965 [Thiobacillus sp.]
MFETACVLHKHLVGAENNWYSFLTDNIRGRQDVAGLTLLPCACRKDGRNYRPVYAKKDIERFVKAVLLAVPGIGKSSTRKIMLEVDPALFWRLNKFEKDGTATPVSRAPAHRKPAKKPAIIRMARRASRSVTRRCGMARKSVC